MTAHRIALAAASAAMTAALALPALAAADSIVYVDQGNVWSATPDGARKVQLTDGGGWHSPTQADDGTIAAVQGTGPIVVMARDGRPLRTITTAAQHSGDGGTFAPRPVQLAFSPDGSKLAYAYVANSCPVASSCGTTQRSVFYTRTDTTEATPVSVWGNQFSVSNPEWVTNDRALVFGGAGSQVSIDDLGGGDYSYTRWMTPNADQGDGELSRDGKRLATTFFYGPDTVIAFFTVNGDPRTETPPAQPDVACSTTPDERLADPSWSPDGSGIAYESSKGIEVGVFTQYAPGACATRDDGSILSPTGQSPDWGPADPPAARYVAAPAAPGPGTQPAITGTPPAAAGPVAGRLSVTARASARQRFRGTVAVTCATPKASTCTVRVTVKVKGRTLRARAVGKVKAGKTATLRPKFSKAAQRSIRSALRRGPVKATISVTATSAAGVKGTAGRTIRLVR